jgi:rare lipoprotein A
MENTNRKRPMSMRAMASFALGSGTRAHGTRVALFAAALGVTATVSAAPSAKEFTRLPASPAAVTPTPAKHHWYEIGKATWYGGDFNGRKTASGTTYNENELTCAHRTLPLGSLVRVTNLQNHRSTLVRVTDRGPWVPNAILDLSHAAAVKLGIGGGAKVGIEQVQRKTATARELAQLDAHVLPANPDGV